MVGRDYENKAVVGTVLIGVAITSAVIIAIETVGDAGWLSSPRSNRMRANAGILGVVKGLIKDQTVDFSKLKFLPEVNATPKKDVLSETIASAKRDLELTKRGVELHPATDPGSAQAQADSIRQRQEKVAQLEKEQAAAIERAKIPPPPAAPMEIVVVGEPFPTQYDPDLDRVLCSLSYRVKGAVYDELGGLTGSQPFPATYTIQPGQKDWLINLLSIS
ncbi:hypothetical protein V1282_003809 [Nitrobacteraceae bacterium AZCC 2146]